jgi:ubiquinone biosynthesis protein COQ4
MLNSLRQWYEQNRIKPIQAGLAISRLLRDPDDTSQVFKVLEALRGDSLSRALSRMSSDERGQRLLEEQPNIVKVLNDRDMLASLPEGSIGRAYYDFVHAEGLSADGLIASSDEAPRFEKIGQNLRWLGDRLRDIHDLQHVMTGYGRDTLGELCLLSFMTSQVPSRGIDFIIFMGRTKGQKENPELDLKSLVREGREIGQSAEWMLFTCWEDRLHEPLDKVREELGFIPPAKYRAALEALEGSQMIRTQAAA